MSDVDNKRKSLDSEILEAAAKRANTANVSNGNAVAFDDATLTQHIGYLMQNMQLCCDGPTLLDRDTIDLHKLLEQRMSLSKGVSGAVKGLINEVMRRYVDALVLEYKKLPVREVQHGQTQVDMFEEFIHTQRKMQKMLAKAVHLKKGAADLKSEQKEFLLSQVDTLKDYLTERVDHASANQHSDNNVKVPSFYPVYIYAYITELFDKIMAIVQKDITPTLQVDIWMILCRQMVLYVPATRRPALAKDVMSSFDLDLEFRFRSGTYNIKGVFTEDFCKRCCTQIDKIAEKQREGVVHFVSGENDIPSRRVWDLLENDTADGVFRQQVRHPVIASINACTLGTDWRIGSLAINETIPGSVGQEEHIDYTKWRKYGPFFCEFPRGEGGLETESLQGTVVFEPFTVETGGTGIIPGSQLWEVYPFTKEQHEEFVRNEVIACCNVGDYLVFNPNCQHRGRANSTVDKTRKGGIYQFVFGGLQPMEIPGPTIRKLIEQPEKISDFWDHYLARIHSWRYPQNLAQQNRVKKNAEGLASALRKDS